MRNLLISVYIKLTKDREDLITMASKFIIPKFPENTNVINKAQRNSCLRNLIKNGNIDNEVQSLIQEEFKRDYSASDEIEKIRLEASYSD